MSALAVPEPVSDDCNRFRMLLAEWDPYRELIIPNAARRKLMRQRYLETHGEDLVTALDKHVTNEFKRLVDLCTLDPAECDAYLANEATKGSTSSNQILIKISLHKVSAAAAFVKTSVSCSIQEVAGRGRRSLHSWGIF